MFKIKNCAFVFFMLFLLSISFSQSMQDLQKMKAEYEKLQKNKNQINLPNEQIPDIDETQSLPKKVMISPYEMELDAQIENKKISKHFGYDFFVRRDTISFWENLPTIPNYLLGPGDELVISLWGETQIRETYIISREGNIYDEKVGLLNMSGKSIDAAIDYLLIQYGRIYATLNGKTPTTFMDVSLGKLRSINVNFVGEVKFPGVYPIHPFSNLVTGLIQVGGVDTTGSLRKIQIKRDGKLLSIVDLYDFFIKGESSSSIQLRDQDIILVPPRSSVILVDSAVVRPGFYESIDGETAYDLIQYAGGPTFDASEKVGIRRIKPKSERSKNGNVFEGLYIDYEATSLIVLNKGDEIIIRRLFKETQQVELIGQVKMPGIYHYYNGMTLKDLLDLGGGIDDSSFAKSIYLKQSEIIRRNPTTRYDKVISVDLNKLLKGDRNDNILLQNLDRLVVHANMNYFEKENVQITGEVNIPGAYPLIVDNESLSSVLNRAGGLTSKALENGIAIYRKKEFFDIGTINNSIVKRNNSIMKYNSQNEDTNFGNSKSRDRFINEKVIDGDETAMIRVAWQNTKIALMPGDSVVVKEKTATVLITGEIYNPGVLEYNAGKSIRYYLNGAGGVTEFGNKQGIIVLYPNGHVKPKKWYSNPRVLEGSTIIVNTKISENPFDITQFATNWTSIISSMITAIVLSQQINQN